MNEAFRSLIEPDLRARQDAKLAAQRAGSVTAQAISLSRGGKGRGLVVRRHEPPLERYATRLVLVTVLR